MRQLGINVGFNAGFLAIWPAAVVLGPTLLVAAESVTYSLAKAAIKSVLMLSD